MRACEKCRVVKALDQFYACKARKDGRGGYCKECVKEHKRAWNESHPGAYRWQWLKRKDNPSYRAARRRASAKYRLAHADKTRVATEVWRLKNLDRRCEYTAQRRAVLLRATPAWANRFFIGEAYHLAKLRTEETGYEWHVDHIVPLKNNLVCGLHVEHNLRVIPGAENIVKSNRHWPDMPVEIG